MAARPVTELAGFGRASRESLAHVLSLVFLAVTLISGPIHDYHYYLNMWYEVEQGHDPWFLVFGSNGVVPLNAYGPLFNLLAAFDWVNPLAPKLCSHTRTSCLLSRQIKGFTASHRPSPCRWSVLTALFWNPFPWVEIAIRGHFDILVALLCLGAIRAWAGAAISFRGPAWLWACLLKYFPVVLLPFLALDRGRIRWRFLVAAVAVIALGLGCSYFLWGADDFQPLTFAATRRSNVYVDLLLHPRPLFSAPVVHGLSELRSAGAGRPVRGLAACVVVVPRSGIPTSRRPCVVAVTTTALFYHTGFPQYHMVPFVLGADWAVRHWDGTQGSTRPDRLRSHVTWDGWRLFDSITCLIGRRQCPSIGTSWSKSPGCRRSCSGCAFLAAVVLSAGRRNRGVASSAGKPRCRHWRASAW